MSERDPDSLVAIVGMAGRFPGARGVDELWANLMAGRPGLRRAAGEHEEGFVPVSGRVEGIAEFDAGFFGLTPREAEITDPQQRLFLECCWEALEVSGHDPATTAGQIGVFGGSGYPDYLDRYLLTRPDLVASVSKMEFGAGNDRDALCTMVSYRLNLRGPSVSVQSFCSSSLVAVHMAAQSLLGFESDIALAGGVALDPAQPEGYQYHEGGIASPDGVVRTFDAEASGTVLGDGVGVVALKRLADAQRDGNEIHAVILGSAMNNDGRAKVGYAAPGTDGQSAVIQDALLVADVPPSTIGYVECHAAGTTLGDSVELTALERAFSALDESGEVCVVSSLKPSIGHLDRASGVTGLIRAALALRHGILPETPNFRTPNSALGKRFEVLTENKPWPSNPWPRRAGVSSFGLGGTNAHVVLEEAPAPSPRPASSGPQLITLSAKDPVALAEASEQLRAYVAANPSLDLADVAFTLQQSRSGHAVRRAVVCSSLDALDGPVHTVSSPDPLVRIDLPAPDSVPASAWSALASAMNVDASEPAEIQQALRRLLLDSGLREGEGALSLVLAPDADDPVGWWWAQLGRLWEQGVQWDWPAFHDGHRRRVSLPTYPFQRHRHWAEPEGKTKRADIADWFYVPGARQHPLLVTDLDARLRAAGPWLVVSDNPVLDEAVTQLRAVGASVTVARPGDDLAGVAPRTVLHGWTAESGFHGALDTLAALVKGPSGPVDLLLVTSGAVGITPADLTNPAGATMSGLAPVISQENPEITCRHVDIDGFGPAPELARRLLAEACAGSGGPVILRGGERWVRDYTALPVPPSPSDRHPVPEGGVVLITGGLGDVGLALADHLARTRRARLVLTARTELPPRDTWSSRADGDDRVARHIRNILALEERGAQVLAASADVADAARMFEVIAEAQRWFGELDLVVHAAGASDASYFALAHETERAQAAAHFRSKVDGLLALREVVPAQTPVVAVSSLSAMLGGLAFAGYAAANAALDAYCRQARASGLPWFAINSDGWQIRSEEHFMPGDTIASYGMSVAEGNAVFDRLLPLMGEVGQVVVSSGDLHARLSDWAPATARPRPVAARHPRPPLTTPYVAPAGEMESRVAALWEEVLGISGVGVDDDFFELGGHSLVAVRLIGLLRETVGDAVPITALAVYPTVRRLVAGLSA
ncbi:SDR family NAD(P)-dependent oxidoreductase [Allokutzneria sp. A3M-2-11 16]|uniref:SDR family NAD(P)-dependent oxidoreductase n=1 Tax=Allokutzneria sp. A3M-2-11 16 TaxID=2962043 RepID=UPI0020B846EE|nr:SDR family NAD(P)-dependent oxidoreductase [Allokutzneria sp. A3M-2-11 16]MCP3803105.1 SDR family NAD(P)-dependent oxidoreductase [Allokutzneria sp. A3M-2-11 16]